MENCLEPILQDIFQLAEVVPEFDACEALHVPVFPGDGCLMEEGCGCFMGMGKEADAAGITNCVDESLGLPGKRGKITVSAEYQQVILLGGACLVVDLLPDQHEHTLISVPVVAFKVSDQYIVVGDDDHIQSGAHGSRSDILVQTTPIRVTGVHVQVNGNLFHDNTLPSFNLDNQGPRIHTPFLLLRMGNINLSGVSRVCKGFLMMFLLSRLTIH
jgi:hypothetical protein